MSPLYSTGLDFTGNPELFTHLQNRERSFLLSVHTGLLKQYRCHFIFILTCDRAEVISDAKVSPEPLERALSLNPAAVRNFRYTFEGDEALRRIFLLSSGILSPLFGEDTIQGQMAQGAEAALLAGTSSPQLRKLFSEAVAFAKRIHTEINTRVFDSTITEEVRRRTEGYGNVLIIGSGEGARKTAEALLSEHSVTMTLRDDSKTFLIPPGTKHVPYDDRRMWIPEADVVISASSGLYHTLTEGDMDLVAGKLLFDLSTPPDLPSSFNAVRTEDLNIELPERNEVERKVRHEAEEEVRKYLSWLERSERAEDTALSAERIATASIRRSSEMIMKLGLDDEKEKAFRSSLMENIRKAALSELIVRKP